MSWIDRASTMVSFFDGTSGNINNAGFLGASGGGGGGDDGSPGLKGWADKDIGGTNPDKWSSAQRHNREIFDKQLKDKVHEEWDKDHDKSDKYNAQEALDKYGKKVQMHSADWDPDDEEDENGDAQGGGEVAPAKQYDSKNKVTNNQVETSVTPDNLTQSFSDSASQSASYWEREKIGNGTDIGSSSFVSGGDPFANSDLSGLSGSDFSNAVADAFIDNMATINLINAGGDGSGYEDPNEDQPS